MANQSAVGNSLIPFFNADIWQNPCFAFDGEPMPTAEAI